MSFLKKMIIKSLINEGEKRKRAPEKPPFYFLKYVHHFRAWMSLVFLSAHEQLLCHIFCCF